MYLRYKNYGGTNVFDSNFKKHVLHIVLIEFHFEKNTYFFEFFRILKIGSELVLIPLGDIECVSEL